MLQAWQDSLIYIYVCSSTLIYLLFTRSVHTVHPHISMIQLGAPQTQSEMLDGHRGGWGGHPGPVVSSKRRQQKMIKNIYLPVLYGLIVI